MAALQAVIASLSVPKDMPKSGSPAFTCTFLGQAYQCHSMPSPDATEKSTFR